MTTAARSLEGAEPAPVVEAGRELSTRNLLIKYQHALVLIEKLAIALLDSVQPDAEPMTPEQARERRQTVAEAMKLVAAETPNGEQMWSELVVERRQAPPGAPLPVGIRTDRRRRSPRQASAKAKP